MNYANYDVKTRTKLEKIARKDKCLFMIVLLWILWGCQWCYTTNVTLFNKIINYVHELVADLVRAISWYQLSSNIFNLNNRMVNLFLKSTNHFNSASNHIGQSLNNSQTTGRLNLAFVWLFLVWISKPYSKILTARYIFRPTKIT